MLQRLPKTKGLATVIDSRHNEGTQAGKGQPTPVLTELPNLLLDDLLQRWRS